MPNGITKSDVPFATLVSGESNCKRIGLVELDRESKVAIQGMEMDNKIIVFDGREENYRSKNRLIIIKIKLFMVNAQELLDITYTKQEKELTKKIDLSNQNLTGSLTIQDFPNLETIKCGNNNLTSLELINLPKLNYFHANNCQLNYIIIDNCPNITEFNSANNLLTSTEFHNNLNSEKLTHLSIHSNNFQEQDLSFLSKFSNLEKLFIDNHSQEKLHQNIYNRFTDENYPPHTNRQYYSEIIMNDKNVVGKLDLGGFRGLKKLICSDNQLTDLDLSDCPNLLELNCSNNEFTNTKFLQTIPDKGKLEVLIIEKNKNLTPQTLDFLTLFTNLHKLDLSDNEFIGSLKPLEKMKELRLIDISRTDIDSGLEYLPDNCRGLYCDPDAKKRESQLPASKIVELDTLQSPEQFSKFGYLSAVELSSTVTTVVGGALTLLDYATTGGVITLVAPLVGAGASQIKIGILKLTKDHKLDKVSEALEILNNRVNDFLDAYDKPGTSGERNGVIDLAELTSLEARQELAQDFSKERPEGGGSQLGDIVQALIKLEEEIRKYRQGFYYGVSEEEGSGTINKESEPIKPAEASNNQLPVREKPCFNIYSNAGAEGGARQAVFHFHLHVVPEREVEKYQEIEKSLQTKQGVIAENKQALAKLIDREQASDYGHVVISSKESDNDLNQIGGLSRSDNSELQIHLIPRYKSQGHAAKEEIPIPKEVLEVAERLRRADNEISQREENNLLQNQVEIPPK
ncbi:25685_t:CDS:2, partial [Racocetra persica]